MRDEEGNVPKEKSLKGIKDWKVSLFLRTVQGEADYSYKVARDV